MRVASPRTSAIRSASRRRRSCPARRAASPREIDADDARGRRPRLDRGDRQVGRPGAEVEHALAAGQRQRLNRALPPAAIDARAQQMIEEIVAARDRIEHPRDASGRLGEICH